jgi:hypothetical protein
MSTDWWMRAFPVLVGCLRRLLSWLGVDGFVDRVGGDREAFDTAPRLTHCCVSLPQAALAAFCRSAQAVSLPSSPQ